LEEFELSARRAANSQAMHLRVQPAGPKRRGEISQDRRLDAAIGIPGIGERGPSPDLGGEKVLGISESGRDGDEVFSKVSRLVLEVWEDHVPDSVPQPMRI
jgi:hypothetical protein